MSQTVQVSDIRKGLIATAQDNYQAVETAMSQALIIESYCQKVILQTPINFGGIAKLQDSQDKINRSLKQSQDNARFYLDRLQPQIIQVLVNVKQFAIREKAVAAAIRKADSMDNILKLIKNPLDLAQKYEGDARNVVTSLTEFQKKVAEDATVYQGILDELNILIDGEQGMLEEYNKQLKTIENSIVEMSLLIAGGAIAILGGAFLIAVGSISSFVTAGTSLKIAAGGFALLVSGVAATTGGAISLAGLLDQKSKLVNSINTVKQQTKVAREYVTTFGDLSTGATNSVKAAQQMINGWNLLAADLKSLYDLLKETSSADDIFLAQEIFAPSIDEQMNSIVAKTNIINQQMTGVSTESLSPAMQDNWTNFVEQRILAWV
ncbi:HBL/NHE enterotoxin family protein [Dolichospermum circinale CS-537/01]|uniref:HBL/NHE enterotoxin family protein n=1 Tax=Dolichospermum circinale CS-537/01 TaxID=3021739 RepID=A0ABT5A4H4_9CYAN|nr:HBL/NHE enterotoxin family protein [Dolichospermum circinale]MDB9486439.1 HBL/NHE enterotoxin family protein [Dolichospermum circinale CS-537/01]